MRPCREKRNDALGKASTLTAINAQFTFLSVPGAILALSRRGRASRPWELTQKLRERKDRKVTWKTRMLAFAMAASTLAVLDLASGADWFGGRDW